MQLLISKDPITSYNYNIIFIIVDRFIKAAKFIPF